MPRALPPRRRGPALLGAAVAAAIGLSACTPQPMPTPTPTPTRTAAPSGDGVLRIGTLLPTTGGSLVGAAQLAGVHAAVREINAAGGFDGTPVEVVSRDSGDADTEVAVAAFAALVERGADVIIGPSSIALVEHLLPLAVEAGIPLISPAVTTAGLGADADGFFARTIPAVSVQGAALAQLVEERRARTVAVVAADDAGSASIAAAFEAALADTGVELVANETVTGVSDASSAVTAITRLAPSAVVFAASDSGELATAVLTELAEAGLNGSRLWLTSPLLGDYSQALPAGAMQGVSGVLEGVRPDSAFLTKLSIEDPGLGAGRYAVEAYDATVIAALAAIDAGDDGGPSIAWRLADVTRDGIRCTSFGECVHVLESQPDIAYAGPAGELRLDAAGTPTRARYALFRYDGENRPQFDRVVG